MNRRIADHLSDLLFAPTAQARCNLLAEGIPDEHIRVTGNTVERMPRMRSSADPLPIR